MLKEKDIMWKYCKINEDESIKCLFCEKDFCRGIKMSILKYHWAKMSVNGAQPCLNVTEDVMNEARNAISMIRRSTRVTKRNREDDISLPPSKVSNFLASGGAAKKPFGFHLSMDAIDGGSTPTEDEAPAIVKALNLKNDYFYFVMQPSYKQYLPIPDGFTEKHFPLKLENVKLTYSGKTWTLGCCNIQKRYKLVRGWSGCRNEMNLNDGSFCVFEMSEGEEIVLKVHIISERKSIHETGTSSSDDDDDDLHFLSSDQFYTDSKTRVTASIDNTKMLDALYSKIASHYGPLEGALPITLHFTAAGMKKDMLQMVLEMIQTKPSDLSDQILTKWELSVKTAAAINFDVGWLVLTLAKMRMTLNKNSNVKLQEEKVESLRKNVNSIKEELKKAQKSFEVASSELVKLKGFEVSGCLDFDCGMFTNRPQ